MFQLISFQISNWLTPYIVDFNLMHLMNLNYHLHTMNVLCLYALNWLWILIQSPKCEFPDNFKIIFVNFKDFLRDLFNSIAQFQVGAVNPKKIKILRIFQEYLHFFFFITFVQHYVRILDIKYFYHYYTNALEMFGQFRSFSPASLSSRYCFVFVFKCLPTSGYSFTM